MSLRINGLKIREGAYLLSPRALFDQAIIATTVFFQGQIFHAPINN